MPPTVFTVVMGAGAPAQAQAAPAEPDCSGDVSDPDFPCLGELRPLGPFGVPSAPSVLTLVPKLGRIIGWGGSRPIEQFDITQGPVPVQLIDTDGDPDPQLHQRITLPAPVVSGALDSARNRFFLGETSVTTTGVRFRIFATSLDGSEFPLNAVRQYQFPAEFASGVPLALAYHAPKDVLYVVTHGTELGQTRTFLHALNAQALVDTPSDDAAVRMWSYQVGRCAGLPGTTGRQPALTIADGGRLAAFVCVAGSTGEDRQNEVVVIDLGTGVDAGELREERHPFLAALDNNPMTFADQVRGRLLVAAAAGVQRAFVFDVKHRAFIGARPLSNLNVFGIALDELRGRLYPVQQHRDLFLVDTAQVPTSQGRKVDLGAELRSFTTGAFDPVSRRLFIPGTFVPFRADGTKEAQVTNLIRVYQDRTSPPSVPIENDPDLGTHDIDEADSVSVDYTGAGTASGARYLWAGGLGGTRFGGFVPLMPEEVRPSANNRDQTFGYVQNAELRDNGTDASAVGLKYGPATKQDLNERSPGCRSLEKVTTPSLGAVPGLGHVGSRSAAQECRNFVRGEPTSTTAPPPEDLPTADQQLQSEGGPFVASTCAVRDEAAVRDAHPGSAVTCDPGDNRVEAAADASEELSQLPLTVATSTASSVVRRSPRGVEVRSTATARGVHVAVPGLGALRMGEVRSVATARAAGRPGTAVSQLKVFYDNVVMTGSEGQVFYTCGAEFTVASEIIRRNHAGGDCDPLEVVRQFNRHFSRHIRMIPPRRDTRGSVMGSPRGAQAAVLKEKHQFWNDFNQFGDDRWEVTGLELVFHMEQGGGSNARINRHIVQLANVFAEAQYRIGQARATFDPGNPDREPRHEEKEGPANLAITLKNLDGQPLAGGTFEVRSGRSAVPDRADVATVCTTAEDGLGDCDVEVPAGPYVVRQLGAPAGYEATAESVPMTLLADVRTEVSFTNARERAAVLSNGTTQGGQPTYIFEGDQAPTPIVNLDGPLPGGDGNGLTQLVGLPGEVLDYILRNPVQALLIGLVWTLLGTPAYLALRRRDLLHTRTSI